MELFINTRTRVQKKVILHIKRKFLSAKGELFVRVGQEVTPGMVIGEGHSAMGFRTIHLAAELGVSPKEALKYLKRSIGKNIYQGELLAQHQGLLSFKTITITSPYDGLIDYYDETRGDLRIRTLPRRIRLLSGAFGVVDKVDAAMGFVLIRTMATVIQGVNGSGMEREGIIKVLGDRGSLISARQLSGDLEKHILVGGGLLLNDAVVKAVELKVKGIITGGINAFDFKAVSGGVLNPLRKRWSDVGLSILISEGFGSAPIGEDIFACLKSYEGKFALVNGNKNRLILPSDNEEDMIYIRNAHLELKPVPDTIPDVFIIPLGIGQKVRLVSNPYFGAQGVVVETDKIPSKLPSGVTTFLITVETKLSKVKVPFTNVEAIAA